MSVTEKPSEGFPLWANLPEEIRKKLEAQIVREPVAVKTDK